MNINWNQCIICQKDKSEPLKCPLDSLGGGSDESYSTFLANVKEFRSISALPTCICFEDNTSVEDLTHHHACWHKSCHLKYSNSKLAAKTKKRKADCMEESGRMPIKRQAMNTNNCMFCEMGSEEGELHQVLTFDANANIRTMVTELQDAKLLTQIGTEDLIAQEAKYHLKCLVKLRNRYRSYQRKNQEKEQVIINEKTNECRVFVELTTYIEKAVESGTLLFRLADLHSLYVDRLSDFGINKTVNKTRLKKELLNHFSEAQEQCVGKSTAIVFKKGMENMLKEALRKRDHSEEATILAKAAMIIRKDVFSHKSFKFDGSFSTKCQENALPSSLKSLISLIYNGLNLKDQDKQESQACLSVGQLIIFNMKKSTSCSTKERHHIDREPPLPIYIGLNIHQQTRCRKLTTQLFQMGISISYDRVLSLEDKIAASLCDQYQQDGVVVPACFNKRLFTIGAIDNLDHNPSSTTSQSSFHGTAISLFQFPMKDNPGTVRARVPLPDSADRNYSLPNSYEIVPAVALKSSDVAVPRLSCIVEKTQTHLDEATTEQQSWIDHALGLLEKEDLTNDDKLAWGAYHALHQRSAEDPPGMCALLPLFYEKAATPSMIKHGMDLQRQAVAFLNPGQIPVTTFDQPLFAIAKYVQWKWPTTHGESMHVVMLGGLHTEMALWKTLGDILEGSGWTTALTEAEIASSGIVDSFLNVAHLARTRHAHQVTITALYKLQQEAYLQSNTNISLLAWRDKMCQSSPTFMFWDFILRYEKLILIFVAAHREKKFPLYVEVLEKLTPLFFAMDHVNYARWMPVHIRDMLHLPESIRIEFEKQGHWVLSKTNNLFSAIPIDQAHEQENANVKGSGGFIGLTECPMALKRWMLSGPELARLQNEFEAEYLPISEPGDPKYFQNHENGFAFQKLFHKQVLSLHSTIKNMGNPFLDDFAELVTLDSRNCMDDLAVNALCTLENIGASQYQEFVKTVLENCSSSIHDPIKKNSIAIFKQCRRKATSAQGKKVKMLQSNVALFGQLYISMQSRDGNLKEFFSHEIQSFPPSLSDYGRLHLPSSKSELLKCIPSSTQLEPLSFYDCRILDGAAIVHFLPIVGAATFSDYATNIFIPYLSMQLQNTNRLDVVWDTYIPDSLKESTREKRGKGIRRKVSAQANIPGKWMDFLCDSKNKTELFSFLTDHISKFTFPSNKQVYVTSGQSVLRMGSSNGMPNCNHEEADTRMVVHVQHALQQGLQTIEIRTVDTDVIVILAGVFYELRKIQPQTDIRIAFGVGKNYRFISINAICSTLGEMRSQALPVFHALTGCDTTSALKGKGKKSAWQAWQACDEVTETFVHLSANPFMNLDTDSSYFTSIERFIVVLYDRTSPLTLVNDAREELFCKRNRSVDRLPPTQDALLQHVRRSIHQAGVWTTSTSTQQTIPSPEGFSWTMTSSSWIPVWMTIPEVSKACRELIKCCCKGNCSNCTCAKAGIACSPLCNCKCIT